MNYKEKIENILQNNMTKKGFKLWKGIDQRLFDIWNKPTSSTGKWHKKMNGEVPTCAEHIYHMLYSAIKIYRIFDIKKNTTDADKGLFAIVLHDSLKYGLLGTRKHTSRTHDKDAADMISQNKETFLKLFTKEQFEVMEESVRFHSGKWSTDAKYDSNFSFQKYHPETLFVHLLDMLSTNDLLQTDVRD